MSLVKKIFLVLASIFLIIDLCLIISVNTINETLLNPDFIEIELDGLGFYSIVQGKIIESIGDDRAAGIINRSVTEAWIKQQTHLLLKNTFGYLRSETDTVNITISLGEIKDNLLAESGLPSVVGNAFRDEIDKQFPDTIDLCDYLKLKETGILEQLRMFFGYFKIFSYALVLIVVIIILLIVLVARNLGTISLTLGLSLLFCGILTYGISALAMGLASDQISSIDIPDFLPRDFLMVFLEDTMRPMKNQGFILLVAGGLLMAVFILLKILEGRREVRGEEETEKLLLGEIEGN